MTNALKSSILEAAAGIDFEIVDFSDALDFRPVRRIIDRAVDASDDPDGLHDAIVEWAESRWG